MWLVYMYYFNSLHVTARGQTEILLNFEFELQTLVFLKPYKFITSMVRYKKKCFNVPIQKNQLRKNLIDINGRVWLLLQ